MTTPDPDDWPTPCGCLVCQSMHRHKPGECEHPGEWYVSMHLIDSCQSVEGGFTAAVVCVHCFKSLVASAEAVLSWAKLGIRRSYCNGCEAPLVRLSNVVLDVARV